MGWDGAGGYTRQHNFSADASSGIKILAQRMDAELDDFASAMTIALTRNAQNVPTANLPMGGFRHINVGAPTSVNNYLRSREFIENIPIFMDDTASSADRISVSAQYFTSVSANQAPGDGTRILVRVLSNKSSAALYLNGHSANVEFQDGNRAAAAMVSGGIYEMLFSSVDVAWKITRPDDGRTAAEISAGVTPTNFQYEPGDIRRYGAAIDDATNDLTALHNCLLANGHINPWVGTVRITGTLTYQANGNTIRGFGGSVSILNYTGSGVGVDFNALDHCVLEGVRILAPSATKAIHIGAISHWPTVRGCDLRGSSTGNDLTGNHSSGNGLEIERSFYGDITNNDISAFAIGIYGFNECNGNFIHANSIRRCNTGVKISSLTGNSDGNDVSGNEIEGGEAGDLYAIDLEGCSNNTVTNNRLEYSPNGTAHIYVHDHAASSTDAVRNDIVNNHCVGTIAALKIGDDSGSSRVSVTTIRNGWYNGSITVGVDADYTHLDLSSNRAVGTSGAGTITNNSTTTRLTLYQDQSFTVGITGGTTSPTASWTYGVSNNQVTLEVTQLVVTSNTVACTITGLPALIRPASSQTVLMRLRDNSANITGLGVIDSSGVITLSNSMTENGTMTNGNEKGVMAGTITYRLP